MSINRALMSSKRASWNTPQVVLDYVRKLGPIALDPCSNTDSIVGASVSYINTGLEADWYVKPENGLVFVNCPYGKDISKWIQLCNEYGSDCDVVALLPARTDTAWFNGVWSADALCFWRGRLRFLGAPSSAPFPSVVAIWSPNPARIYRFAEVFSEVGRIILP